MHGRVLHYRKYNGFIGPAWSDAELVRGLAHWTTKLLLIMAPGTMERSCAAAWPCASSTFFSTKYGSVEELPAAQMVRLEHRPGANLQNKVLIQSGHDLH